MLSRRSILRALGFGAPAAVVAAAVGVPAAAGASPVNVAGLSAIDANIGALTVDYATSIRGAVAGDMTKLQAQIDRLQADVPSMALKAVRDAKRRSAI